MQQEPNKQPPRRTKVARHPGVYYRNTARGRVYEVTFRDSDGRRRWRRVQGNLEDAERVLTAIKQKLHTGEPVRPGRLTLTAFAEEWLAGQTQLRPASLVVYRTALRRLPSWLGRKRLADVTVDDVARLVGEWRQAGYAARTIRAYLTVLGRVLGRAERRGLIPANPVRKLERDERPQIMRREFPELDREAVGRLIAATPEAYRALVAVSVLTGLRQGEALGLRWGDVDTKAGLLRVRCQLDRSGRLVEPKTAAAKRDVPIPPSLASLLSQHRQQAFAESRAKAYDYAFASAMGRPFGRRAIVRRGLEPALAAAKLPGLSWHDLRHLAASMMIAEGASVGFVSRVLGHSSPAITLAVYAHQFEQAEHADRMRERMEAAFAPILGNVLETSAHNSLQLQ
jgi:integrase